MYFIYSSLFTLNISESLNFFPEFKLKVSPSIPAHPTPPAPPLSSADTEMIGPNIASRL